MTKGIGEPPAPLKDPIEKLAEKAHDLEAVRKSVEDAASISGGLWLSYLFTLFYIGIAAGAVTHRDLLLENPVKLPFLNVELPLKAFFFLAPFLFVIVHVYTLTHFVMLAGKAGNYRRELEDQLLGSEKHDTSEGLRRQLPSNIFVQFLVGPYEIRKGGLGWVMRAIAWISLVFGPVLLLLLIQAQFLAYHLWWVTLAQRGAVLVDLCFLWILWPAILSGRTKLMFLLECQGKGARRRLTLTARHALALIACAIALSFAVIVERYPDEWLYRHIGRTRWIPANPVTAFFGATDKDGSPKATSLHDLLFYGEINELTRRRKSFFSNTLVLSGFDALEAKAIDDPKKLDFIKHTLTLRARNLEDAILNGADLRKADFVGAHLQRASFNGAQLQGASLSDAQPQHASFNNAQLQHALLDHTQLQDALFKDAQLEGASLEYAQLQRACFNHAQLQEVLFRHAQLQIVSLEGAQLQGASLKEAHLEGASLKGAQLQGASLEGALLQGASLEGAQLQGASLKGAQLQGASLKGAQLQGASLEGALLQGASLEGAQLQGTDFRSATLQAADFYGSNIWRTRAKDATLSLLFTESVSKKPMSKQEFNELKQKITASISSEATRQSALKQIQILDPNKPSANANPLKVFEKSRADRIAYQKALAEQLEALACSNDESAPYVVDGLLKNRRIEVAGPYASQLASDILARSCPVSAALPARDEAKLKRIVTTAAPSSSEAEEDCGLER